jgi:hypothetical protein
LSEDTNNPNISLRKTNGQNVAVEWTITSFKRNNGILLVFKRSEILTHMQFEEIILSKINQA